MTKKILLALFLAGAGGLVVGLLSRNVGAIAAPPPCDDPLRWYVCVGVGDGPPDRLSCVCLDPHNAVGRAAARESCDEIAQAVGYHHGVLRPQVPSDDDFCGF